MSAAPRVSVETIKALKWCLQGPPRRVRPDGEIMRSSRLVTKQMRNLLYWPDFPVAVYPENFARRSRYDVCSVAS